MQFSLLLKYNDSAFSFNPENKNFRKLSVNTGKNNFNTNNIYIEKLIFLLLNVDIKHGHFYVPRKYISSKYFSG